MDWIAAKAQLATWTGLDRDALHVYAGMLGSIGAAAILRRTLASPLPWLLVLLAELANEAGDMLTDNLVEQWEIDGAKHDLWNTMVAPTLLLLTARFAPQLMRHAPTPEPMQEPAASPAED